MLREKLKAGLLKPLLLLAALLALSQTASAWTYYYLRGDGDDYSAGKRIRLTWNSSSGQYEETFTLESDWTCKLTVSNSANSDSDWYGPSSATTVQNQDATVTVNLQKDGQMMTLKAGTYTAYLKVNNNAGSDPTVIYFKKTASSTYNWYLRGSWGSNDSGWNTSGQKAFVNNTLTFTNFNNYTFQLFDGSNWQTDEKYYNTSVFEKVSGTNNWKLKNTVSGGTVVFQLTTKDNHPYLSATTTQAEVKKNYYVHYQPNEGDESWSDSQKVDIEAGKSYTFTVHMSHNSHFGLMTGSTWYGPSADLELSTGGNTTNATSSNGKHYIWAGGDGDVKITVTLNTAGAVSKVAVTGPAYNIENEVNIPTTGTYLYGYLAGDDPTLITAFGQSNNSNGNCLITNAGKTARNFYYVIYNGGKRYGRSGNQQQNTGDWDYKNAVSLNESSKTSGDYWYVTIPAKSTVKLNYQYSNFGINNNINGFSNANYNDVVWFTDKIDFVPDMENVGAVYLLADQLNGKTESPEWLMEDLGDGEYVLRNFAMRPVASSGNEVVGCVPFVRWYDEDGGPHEVVYAGSNMPGGNTNMSPGWAFNAKFTLADKHLSLNTVSTAKADQTSPDILPYLGILGANFIQAKEYKTGDDFYNSTQGRWTMGNTSRGWQEAYIQYDVNGNPVLDDDNNAYYNTYWPPRNNILMESYIGDDVDPLKTSVSELSFRLDSEHGVLTATEWKEQLGDEEYKQLQLDGSKRYVRYTVPGMWMLGTFKIWTGWAGYKASWGAQWNGHLYWGPSNNNMQVESNVTYTPSTLDSKDFSTTDSGKDRMYFKTMEFFIPVTVNGENKVQSYDFGQCKLYMTDATGEAKIDSKSTNKHGGYYPSLGQFPSGYKLSGYTITRYKYDPNAEAGSYEPCDRTGDTGSDDVVVRTWSTSDPAAYKADSNAFAADFTCGGEFGTKYVDDGEYTPGLYIYSFDVTFTNDAGETRTDKVWSPYIQIFDTDYVLTLSNVQLIDLGDANADGRYDDYTHISYNSSMNGMLVKVVGNKVTKATRLSTYEGSNAARRCAEIYEQEGMWTNMAMLAATKPALYTQQGGKDANITRFDIYKDGAMVVNLKDDVTPINGAYYFVVNRGAQLGAAEFTGNFVAKVVTEGGEQEVNITGIKTTYKPGFMVPGLGSADFDFRTSDELTDYSMTHEAMDDSFDGVATTYGNSLNFDIPISMPRILPEEKEPGLARAVLDNLTVNITRVMRDGTEETMELTEKDPSRVLESTLLHYDAQSPYDWLEAYISAGGNDLTDRYWHGVARTWRVNQSHYSDLITPRYPKLSDPSMTILLQCKFYTPEIEKARLMKCISPVEGKLNTYTFSIYLVKVQWGAKHDASIAMEQTRLFDLDRLLPEASSENNPIYAVVTRDANEKQTATTLLTYDGAQDSEELYLLWKSDEVHWYAEMYDHLDRLDPGLTLYISRAYPFYAANDENGSDRESHFEGVLGDNAVAGTILAIRYDQKEVTPSTDAPAAAPRRSAPMRADDNNTEEEFIPGDEAVKLNPDAGDNAFLFVPRYTAYDGYNTQTSVEFLDAAEAGVEAGVGYIDVKGNYSMIFDAAGKLVYNGEGRVEVPAGVYVVNTFGGAMKVIVR